jgi:hypothetical protein
VSADDDKTPPERPMRKRHPSLIPGAVPSAGSGVLIPSDPKKNDWEGEQPRTDPGFRRAYKKYNRKSMGWNALLATVLSAAFAGGIKALEPHAEPAMEKVYKQVNDHEYRIRTLESVINRIDEKLERIDNKLTEENVFRWIREHKK